MKDANSTIDLGGWATAAAITYTDVNKAIAASPGVPTTFTVAASDGSASATGDFGSWQLTLGGSGSKIQMAIAITSGSITGPFGQDYAVTKLQLTPCSYPVTIQATFLPQAGDSTLVNLQADAGAGATVGPPLGTNPFSSFMANAAFQTLLEQWFEANLSSFTAVFASVDLDADYANEGLSWLKPTFQGYAVAEPAAGATLDNSVFGVLSLIDGDQPPADLSYTISSFAIPSGSAAGFLVSSQKFLQHMMFVAVPYMFSGITQDDPNDYFTINNGGTTIMNTADLTLLPFKLADGTTVNPTIGASNFTITLDGTELSIVANGMEYSPSLGIDVSFDYTGKSTLGLDTTNNVLELTPVTQTGTGQVTVDKGMQITEIALGIAAILASIVAAGGGTVVKAASSTVTGAVQAAVDAGTIAGDDAAAAANVQVSVLQGLISGTAQEVTSLTQTFAAVAKVAAIGAFITGTTSGIMGIVQAVAQGDYESTPQITDLTSAAVGQTVQWPAAVGTYVLSSAQLNGAMQFGLARS